jgi:cyclopropane fatty-acyl-phospholipid synthase-like methyltransferase
VDLILLSIALLIVIIAALWILVPAYYGLPPISTRRERVIKAFQLADLQPNETLYDLGCGHGNALVIAAKEFGARAVGIEAGPVQCLIAWINSMNNGVSSKVRIEAGDFYKADLSQADVVYAYLTSTYAPRLQEQLTRQLKPGARVVTVAFELPDLAPQKVDRESLIYLYRL